MATTKLTKRNLEGIRKQTIATLLSSGERDTTLWDEDLVGLGLRIAATGHASWLVQRRLGSGGSGAKQIRHAFASLADLPDPEKARERARAILEGIRNGIDPNAQKRSNRLVEAIQYRDGKLGDLWTTWLTKCRIRGKEKRLKSSDYWYGIERLGKVEVLPILGSDTMIHTITKAQVRKLVEDKEAKSPAVARMIFAALRPFFLWCVEREAIAISPMNDLSQPSKVKARDRTLNDSEIVAVWSAASVLPYPWGPFYKLALLTAQRRDEVAAMEWSELNLKKREWIIPSSKTKNGKAHLVHLSPWATEILHSIQKQAGARFVFTTSDEVAISGFSKARLALDDNIKKYNNNKTLSRFTVHDLRRTAATGMASLKVPPHVVERILNHITGRDVGGLVGVYQYFEYVDERREALILWANHINELLLEAMKKDSKASPNVVRISSRTA